MASASLGALTFLPPQSLRSRSSAQQEQHSHGQIFQQQQMHTNPNISLSFSNSPSKQSKIGYEEYDDGGDSKLEIIEEAQEELAPKENDTTTNPTVKCFTYEDKKEPSISMDFNDKSGARMRSCLMDDNMSSKEAVESLLLLGREAVVGNSVVDPQTGVRTFL